MNIFQLDLYTHTISTFKFMFILFRIMQWPAIFLRHRLCTASSVQLDSSCTSFFYLEKASSPVVSTYINGDSDGLLFRKAPEALGALRVMTKTCGAAKQGTTSTNNFPFFLYLFT